MIVELSRSMKLFMVTCACAALLNSGPAFAFVSTTGSASLPVYVWNGFNWIPTGETAMGSISTSGNIVNITDATIVTSSVSATDLTVSGPSNLNGAINSIGTTQVSTNTIGLAGNSINTMTGETNAITAGTINSISAGTDNVVTATQQNQLTGGTGNTIAATTGNNAISAMNGSNTVTANATNQSNTLTATGSNGSNNLTANDTTGSNNIEAKANNVGVATPNSVNTIGSTSAGTTVTARGGESTLSIANGTASLTAGPALATNGTAGNSSNVGSGGLTVYNSSQTIADGTTIPMASAPDGILAGKSYQNMVNGNLLVDGNVYINGTLDYVSSDSANTTVIGSMGTSNLVGATQGATAGTAIVMSGSTGTQTVVDANGKLRNVTGTATESTASMTLTNGVGNTHGIVVTEQQTTVSGGVNSSSLTLNDNGATFSNASNGNPVQVHGVDDGTGDYDAVNIRQFATGVALAVSLAGLPQVEAGKTFAIAAGTGVYMDKYSVAFGLSARFKERYVVKGGFAMSPIDRPQPAGNLAIGYSW